jgi:hypothetical protein
MVISSELELTIAWCSLGSARQEGSFQGHGRRVDGPGTHLLLNAMVIHQPTTTYSTFVSTNLCRSGAAGTTEPQFRALFATFARRRRRLRRRRVASSAPPTELKHHQHGSRRDASTTYFILQIFKMLRVALIPRLGTLQLSSWLSAL